MSDFRNRLLKAKSNVQAPTYKRLFVSPTQGREYCLRFLDPKVIDGEGLPFAYVYLHGNYMHPNFDQKFPSNFRCGGKGCPLCTDARAISKKEKDDNVPKNERQAFKKQARKYAIYWAINEENGELTLVHIPDFSYSESEETINQMLANKLLELDEMGLAPFDLKLGMDIVISTTAVDKKIKFSIHQDNQSTKEVPQLVVKKLEQMKPLNLVYKKYTTEELDKVVKGEKIAYGQAKEEQISQKAKTDFQKEEKSISEENFNFAESTSEAGGELDDLLTGDLNMDDLTMEGPTSEALSDKLKRLSTLSSRGSEDE